MKKNIVILIILILIVSLTGCNKSIGILEGIDTIFYFDISKNELVEMPLPKKFTDLNDEQDKSQYIIQLLTCDIEKQENESIVTKPIPIKEAINNISEKNIQIYLKDEYNTLTSNEKIGIRASIVYSLTQLDSIESISFYIGDQPLTSSNGKIIGPVTKSNIKLSTLEPNPAITPYTLPLYFVNDSGKLVKEDRGIHVSDPASVEKSLIQELIKGPNSDILSPSLPPDTIVNEAVTSNGVCQVDLSFDVKSKFFTSIEDKERMLYAIVNSLTEITELTNDAPKIKKVAFLIDGKSDIEFTQNIQLRDTFERNEDYIEE